MWNSASLKFCHGSVMFDQPAEWKTNQPTYQPTNQQTKNRSNETLQSTHRNTKGRPVHDDLWWGKWLTYQSILPILAILLLTWCSGTLSESCLTGLNWYGCILVGLLGQVSASSLELKLAFAATPQSDVVRICAHDFGVMAMLLVQQKMPFFVHL